MMFKLDTKNEIDEKAPDRPGIYKIYWIKNGVAQLIPRIGGNDTKGLLYIGETKGSLVVRLNQFRCTAFIGSTNHSGGLKLRTNKKLASLVKKEDVFVKVEACDDPHSKEIAELKKYADEFGEVPPLNG
jgi:hypothetical protein